MLYETDAGDLIEFAKRWAALGDAIADQVAQVVKDPRAGGGRRARPAAAGAPAAGHPGWQRSLLPVGSPRRGGAPAPGARPGPARGPRGVEGSRARFFEHIPKPAEALFQKVITPKDGKVDLSREIPAGEFWMGSPEDEEGRYDWEGPRHQVKITRAFQMAAVPVTNAQYAAFDLKHEWEQWEGVSEEELRHHPVVNVSWYQAVIFCRWLSTCFEWARGCRLPTEAEWEYACRAGTATRYWSGDKEADLARVGWYGENSGGRTHRVGEKEGNPWGLYDVHGNVWEWCEDAWDSAVYRQRASGVTDQVNIQENSADRVVRGGSWALPARDLRAACRGGGGPSGRFRARGFRCVCLARLEP